MRVDSPHDLQIGAQRAILETIKTYIDNHLSDEPFLKNSQAIYYLYYEHTINCYPNLGKPYEIQRWKLVFDRLTHEQRHLLIELLQKADFKFDEIPMNFYSES